MPATDRRTAKARVTVNVVADVRDIHVRIEREIYGNGALVRECEWVGHPARLPVSPVSAKGRDLGTGGKD